MLARLDLQALAELEAPERAFLTLYLSKPDDRATLDHRFKTIRALLADEEEEREHFEQNLKLIEPLLETWPKGDDGSPVESVCVFACWALDYAHALPLPVEVETKVWVGAAPYIRPLAELQDEYETFAVALVDNTSAQLFLVADADAEEERRVRGDVKNRVKVGGWSQKRYARRREKELSQYATDIASALGELDAERSFSRLVLLGSDEAMAAVGEALPQALAEKLVGSRSVDLDEPEAETLREAFAVYFEGERESERRLWDQIREGLFTEGLAASGATSVLDALEAARAEAVLVDREAEIEGRKCRSCEHVMHGTPQTCQRCGSADLFEVDLVEALVERAARTGADVDFTDPFDALSEVGHVAALLRY